MPQGIVDAMLLYGGVPIELGMHKKTPGEYPRRASDEIFLQDRVRMFCNVPTWLEFLSDAQLSFGSRIHGNIAGVLAGVPSFIFASDMRVMELAKYHNIPHMLATDVNESTNIVDIYEKTDFTSVNKGHKERVDRYLSFLRRNGIEPAICTGEESAFDKKLEDIKWEEPVHSLMSRPISEQSERLAFMYDSIVNNPISYLKKAKTRRAKPDNKKTQTQSAAKAPQQNPTSTTIISRVKNKLRTAIK